MKPIVTSVAFGEGYTSCLHRLKESLDRFGIDYVAHEDAIPTGARPHSASPYGFKVHAIELLLKAGHKQILWLDATCIVEAPIEPLFERMAADKIPVVAVYDSYQLFDHASDAALSFFHRSRDAVKVSFVGGSMYAFDFTQPDAETIFHSWKQAESAGLFAGSDHGHRHDETCLALALYSQGQAPCTHTYAGYDCGIGLCNGPVIVTKRHFR